MVAINNISVESEVEERRQFLSEMQEVFYVIIKKIIIIIFDNDDEGNNYACNAYDATML